MPGRTANVRYWGEIGLNADIGIWAVFDLDCVKTHASAKCGKYNSPTRHWAVWAQYDLTLKCAISVRCFYARRGRSEPDMRRSQVATLAAPEETGRRAETAVVCQRRPALDIAANLAA
jgi:hypothetical protein